MSSLDLLPFRRLLDVVVAPVRRHFRALYPPIAVPMAIAATLLAVVQLRTVSGLFSFEMGEEPAFEDMFSTMFTFAGMGLVYLLIYSLAFSVLSVAAVEALAGRPPSMARCWRFVFRPPVLGTLGLVMGLSLASMMLCFVPAFYFIPLLSFVLPVMVEEGLTGTAAISRAVELAHFNPRGRLTESPVVQMAVLIFVGWLISYAIVLLVQLPLVIVQQVMIFRGALGGEPPDPGALMSSTAWLQIPTVIIGALASVATWFYWAFGIALLYREVRRRKEGNDLAAAIEKLTTAGAAPADAGSMA